MNRLSKTLMLSVVDAFNNGTLLRSSDGARPPRPYVALLLRKMGQVELGDQIYGPPVTYAGFQEAMADFTTWFSVAMAKRGSAVRRLPLKRGKRCKLRLLRQLGEGQRGPRQVVAQCALGSEWATVCGNQTRPVVANALQATQSLKRLLTDIFGDGCVSLGTVGTERVWWHTELKNLNPTGVWGATDWLQYRLVVTWKDAVLVGLRRQSESLKRDVLLQELLESFTCREPDRSSIIHVSGQPDKPDPSEINVAYDAFHGVP